MTTPPETAAARLAGPATVMPRFGALRGRLLRVIDQGEALAEALGVAAAQVTPHFAGARRTVDLSRLTLTVIGAEGAGKSTLINAITGADVTPREELYPGTVAPTFVEWSQAASPEYLVALEGEADLRRCRDRAEFQGYILQAHNPENVKRVLSGVVRQDLPLLRDGLRLVDVPGVEGVSGLISRSTLAFIRGHTHAAIVVVRGRPDYGRAARLLEALDVGEQWVQAVVVNNPTDFFTTGTEGPGGLAAKLAAQRTAAVAMLRGEEWALAPEQVYVLHLPSVYDARIGAPPAVADPLHGQEAANFEAHLWQFVRAHGVFSVIQTVANAARTANGELLVRLTLRRGAVQALAGPDPRARERVTAQFQAARARALAAWERVGGPAMAGEVAGLHWRATVRPAAERARDQALTALNTARAELAAVPGKIGAEEARAWQARLNGHLEKEATAFETAQNGALDAIVAGYCAQANEVLATLARETPLLTDSLAVQHEGVTPASVAQWRLGSLEPSVAERLLEVVTVTGSATVSGKLAGGGGIALLVGLGLNPVAALVVGAVAGGTVAWGAWRMLRSDRRGEVERALTRSQAAVQALDLSDNGPVADAWRQAVEAVADDVGAYLRQRLDELAALIAAAADEPARLAAALEQVERAVAAARTLDAELDAIATEARRLAGS